MRKKSIKFIAKFERAMYLFVYLARCLVVPKRFQLSKLFWLWVQYVQVMYVLELLREMYTCKKKKKDIIIKMQSSLLFIYI